jgi:transcriptional regulator with XRE-family HTH domain
MTVGPTIRERRAALGISQEQLAREAGLTWSAVQRLEAGKTTDPHYSTLESIARVLGMTVEELVLGKASTPPETGHEAAMPGPSGHAHRVQIAEDSEGTRVEVTKTSFFELMRDVKAGRLSEEDAWQRFQEEAG